VQLARKYFGALATVIKPSAVNEEPNVDQLEPSKLPCKTTVADVMPLTCKNAGAPASHWTALEAPVAVTALRRVVGALKEAIIFP
jgi:hypothetical protein